MKTAKDLMTSNPLMIQTGEDLHEVVKKFIERGIKSAPVVTPLGEVWGFITELGLVKAYLRHHFDNGKDEKLAHHRELVQPATYVQENESASDVMKAILRAPTHRVLVQNEKDKIVGIVTAKDILKFLMGEIVKTVDFRKEFASANDKLHVLVAQLKTTEEVLESYQGMIQEMPYMVHCVNADGKIIMANKKLHETLGYTSTSLLGKSLDDLYSDAVLSEAFQGLKRVQEVGSHQLIYSSMKKSSGEAIRVDVLSSSLKDKSGKFICTITVSRVVDSELLLRALNGVLTDEEKQFLIKGFKTYA